MRVSSAPTDRRALAAHLRRERATAAVTDAVDAHDLDGWQSASDAVWSADFAVDAANRSAEIERMRGSRHALLRMLSELSTLAMVPDFPNAARHATLARRVLDALRAMLAAARLLARLEPSSLRPSSPGLDLANLDHDPPLTPALWSVDILVAAPCAPNLAAPTTV